MGNLVRVAAIIYLVILGYITISDAVSNISGFKSLEFHLLIIMNIVYLLMGVGIFYAVYALINNLRKKYTQILGILITFYFFYAIQQIIHNKLTRDVSPELLKSLGVWLIVYLIPVILIYINLKLEFGKSHKK